ncbi:MAG: hypothetical protein EHM24_09390 [Acidobacteria bacterium]|nr:MAG: hypothetical protein EHM24_09390 [Acidobacteriota bacterium]
MRTAVLIEPPTTPWCTVAQAKQYLQFPYDTQDDVIAGQIRAAEDLVEAYCERGLRTQTWRLKAEVGLGTRGGYGVESSESHADFFTHNLIAWRPGDGGGGAGLDLRRAAPLQSIRSATVNGLPFTGYRIEESEPARLILTEWPSAGPLVVEYVVGYSDDTSRVPGGLVEAMRKLMATYFLHREEDPVISFRVETRVDMLPVNVQQLLDPYRCVHLA